MSERLRIRERLDLSWQNLGKFAVGVAAGEAFNGLLVHAPLVFRIGFDVAAGIVATAIIDTDKLQLETSRTESDDKA